VAAVIAGAAGLSLTAPASAEITDVVIRIEATNSLGTGVFEGYLSEGSWQPGGVFVWERATPMNFVNAQGEVIASMNAGRVRVINDPVVQLNFSVSAGTLDTSFVISSPLLSFPTINQAEGRATAGVTVTDTDGNGATLSGGRSPLYTSRYNGLVPGGTLFTNLIAGPVTAAAFDSATDSESFPGGGAFAPIAGPVSDMSARFAFTLSANDEASGTSSYEIREVPAPGAVALLGLGGLIAARRRRH
jgi:MYXO-CTERM domain-containing protein